jgi:hypothetical protein
MRMRDFEAEADESDGLAMMPRGLEECLAEGQEAKSKKH